MNDTKKREAWLRELKSLRKELLEKTNRNNSQSLYPKTGKSYQKGISGIASGMYDKDKESAKINVLLLALLTFIFETLFFIGSYFLFSK